MTARESASTEPAAQPHTARPDGRRLVVLLVEDSAADAELTSEALSNSHACAALHMVPDGVAALAFLRRQGTYADAPRPDLILLDLNLPRKDGRGVLAEIKQDPVLRHIPVVVLTSSEAEQDIARAYELHANCYVTKPVDLDQFVKIVRSIEQFWFTVVKLPQHE